MNIRVQNSSDLVLRWFIDFENEDEEDSWIQKHLQCAVLHNQIQEIRIGVRQQVKDRPH